MGNYYFRVHEWFNLVNLEFDMSEKINSEIHYDPDAVEKLRKTKSGEGLEGWVSPIKPFVETKRPDMSDTAKKALETMRADLAGSKKDGK